MIPESRLGPIFRDTPGTLRDTATDRRLLQEVVDDVGSTLGTDKYGNIWSARLLPDGTQVWTQVRNGEIINGGLNLVPRNFHPLTGLASPTVP